MVKTLINGFLVLTLVSGLPAIAGVDDDETPLARMVIEKSGITARIAIERALAEFPGIVYEYELEEDDDRFIHEIELANLESKRTHKIKIDAQSGEVVDVESSRASSWFKDDDDVKAAREINKYGLSLLDAVKKAAAADNNLLVEVEFKQKQGISFFKVEFMGDTGEKKTLVDIETRDVIPYFRK